jgi:two-component system sensor histidine kinase KdpD
MTPPVGTSTVEPASESGEECWLEAARHEFLRAALHDLRNQVGVVHGWAHLVGMGVGERSTLTDAIEAVKRSVRSQTELLNDLDETLAASRAPLTAETMDLTSVLRGLADEMVAARSRDVTIVLGSVDRPRPVLAAARCLERLLRRALQYAANHSPRGERVVVEIEDRGQSYRIRIIDRGPGPVRTAPPQPFERLERIGASRREDGRTLVLDLALMRASAERIGAALAAEAALASGSGLVVTIEIPSARGDRE